MKKSPVYILSAIMLSLSLTGLLFAQQPSVKPTNTDVYVISTKAGAVSYTEGTVTVVRKDGKSGYLLKNDKLEAGDKVSTGSDGRVEILLNPGSYLRLGANSTFEFQTTDLDDLKLKLSGGSAIFEVLTSDDFKISVKLPQAEFALTRSGVFRIDVLSDGSGKISVWKGKVFAGNDRAELKGGRSALVDGSNVTIARFDRDNPDELDTWSKLRAKEFAKLNARLERLALRDSLLNSFNQGVWNLYNSFGLWIYDPVRLSWCFLPFGIGWASPYGYNYYSNIWNCRSNLWGCRLPYYIYTTPPPVTNTPPATNAPSPNQTNRERWQRLMTPTFLRVNPSGDAVEERRINRSAFPDSSYDRDVRPGRNNPDTRIPRNTGPDPSYDTKPTYVPPPTPIIVMPNPAKAGKDN
jgi:hypothetical protein